VEFEIIPLGALAGGTLLLPSRSRTRHIIALFASTTVAMNQRAGNFDLMRLIAASLVFWSHQYSITGFNEPLVPWVGSLGGLAVYVFFAISGYLNSQSVVRSRSSAQFLISRAFRIYPALIVCVALCVVMGAFVTTSSLSDYFAPPGLGFNGRDTPFSFFWRDSTLFFGLDFRLPGVFEASLGTTEVLTPLWTLPQEAKLYVYLAIVALVCRFDARVMGSAMIVVLGGFAAVGLWRALGPIWLGERGLTCAILFASGVGVASLQRWLSKTIAIACFLSIAALLLLCGNKETFVLVVIAPVCVILNDLPLPRWTAPKLDISFGVYLYALPIQHLTSALPLSFWGKGLLAFAITLVAGTLSALLVEQPMLKMRKQIGPMTWLDNLWPALRAIAKSERRFLSAPDWMRRNAGRAQVLFGGEPISVSSVHRGRIASKLPAEGPDHTLGGVR
jgi:peptidoglycan/LPS O-acetylase OafA/YrhL